MDLGNHDTLEVSKNTHVLETMFSFYLVAQCTKI